LLLYNAHLNEEIVSSLNLEFNQLPSLHSTERVHILEDRSLKIDNITMEDVGEYSCEAENAVGAIVASGTLLVNCKFNDDFIVFPSFSHFSFIISYSAAEIHSQTENPIGRARR
jgi:hypothetical protein